jgi:spermidine/putrescine transport system permease protein
MAAPAVTPELEAGAERAESRRGFLLAVPGWVYLIIFFAIPLAIVVVYSFASRSATGQTLLQDWNLDSYQRLASSLVLEVVFRSLWLAAATTIICLLLGYPFAFYIATRGTTIRNVLLVLVLIPFWSNFLVRTYAWRVLLGSEGPISQLSEALGFGETRVLFTTTAVLVGLVYGYLPFMVLPLYAAIERIDWSLVEAGRDLYASGWNAFRRITWPLSRPGVIAGSVLVFIPSLGAYVTPEILGGARTTLLGSFVVSQFLAARNWPFGSALSVAILAVMLGATMVYFRTGGRTL